MIQKLKQLENKLAWQHAGFWAKVGFLAINWLLALLRFYRPLSAAVGLASTHYSVTGTAREQLRESADLFRSMGWALLFVWSVPVAVVLVVLLYPLKRFLSADQCDVCSRVTLRARLNRLASGFARVGMKKPSVLHTRGFFRTTLAEIHLRDGRKDLARNFMETAYYYAYEAEDAGEAEQAGRIYKQLSVLQVKLGGFWSAQQAWDEAQRLFTQAGAEDQLLKLGPRPRLV